MFNVSGLSIQISAGDTGVIRFEIEGTSLTEKDRGVFTVKNRNGMIMIKKIIQPERKNEICVPFVNGDTEHLTPGVYEWDMRIAIKAKIAENGDVVDGESVVTPYLPARFTVLKVVGNV